MISVTDRAELRLFERYLARRAEQPDENVFLAYAEVYGEVVFEDTSSGDIEPQKGHSASPRVSTARRLCLYTPLNGEVSV